MQYNSVYQASLDPCDWVKLDAVDEKLGAVVLESGGFCIF